jgi:hypothetical protein
MPTSHVHGPSAAVVYWLGCRTEIGADPRGQVRRRLAVRPVDGGWDVTVLLTDHPDDRPLHILG